MGLPKGLNPNDVDLPKALALLALPRDIGKHPETGDMIQAGIGRFGPFLKHGSSYSTLPPEDDVLMIGINRAVVVIAEAKLKGGNRRPMAGTPAKVLGNHPTDGKPVKSGSGRFGPYVQHGKTYASVPKSEDAATLTLDRAVELIDAKVAKGPSKKGKGKKAAAAPAEAPAEKPAKKPRKKKVDTD
jgi:DNA topoisomerase-1